MLFAAASWLGTAPGWLTLAAACALMFRLSRGGGGSAVSELSKANEVLQRTLKDERQKNDALGAEVRDLRTELAELRGRTDFATALAAALEPLLEWTTGHERRAQDRHEAQMRAGAELTGLVCTILEMVAKRLGPEPPNGDSGVSELAA